MSPIPTAACVDAARSRGYVDIGICGNKYEVNLGTLIRTAHAMGGTFVFTIGRRYEGQPSDVGQDRHVPVLHFESLETFLASMPANAAVVCVEADRSASSLPGVVRPEQAVYLLGAEDHGLPDGVLADHPVVEVPSDWPLNVATAGSIVLYDRLAKRVDSERSGFDWLW